MRIRLFAFGGISLEGIQAKANKKGLQVIKNACKPFSLYRAEKRFQPMNSYDGLFNKAVRNVSLYITFSTQVFRQQYGFRFQQ